MNDTLEVQQLEEQLESSPLQDLLPEEGMWLVHFSKFVMDVTIALAVVYYLPVIAIILMTMYGFSYMKSARQTTVFVVPIIWGSNLLVYNVAELATVVVYLSVRKLTSQIVGSIGRKLCDSIQTSQAL